jgi:hypothetical protein
MQPFLFLSGAVQKSAAGGMGKMGDGSALTGETLYKRDLKVGWLSASLHVRLTLTKSYAQDLLFMSYYVIFFSLYASL